MNQEDIYLDLAKCDRSQIKNIPHILAKSAEKLNMEDSLFLGDITNGKYLAYHTKRKEWITIIIIDDSNRTEISYLEFITLFESQYFNYNVFISNLQEN